MLAHKLLLQPADGRGRALIVGGGIANFTDVAATFKGIIQVRAVRLLPGLAWAARMPGWLASNLPACLAGCQHVRLCHPLLSFTASGPAAAAVCLSVRLQAFREKADAIRAAKMRIFVRRGVPCCPPSFLVCIRSPEGRGRAGAWLQQPASRCFPRNLACRMLLMW